jgi:uncharacterized protein (DUF1778 family)
MTTTLKIKFNEETAEYLKYAAAIKGITVEKFIADVAQRNDFRDTINDSALDVVGDYERSQKLPSSLGSSEKASEAELNQCWENMTVNRAALGV